MGKYFGTDGFRGRANRSLTAVHAFRVGRFLGNFFSDQAGSRRARIVLGKDTRRSSYTLEYALAAGITASGADAYLLHVTTTPSVSYVTRTENFDCGVMISASHNLFEDNGIKLVNSSGEKMSEELLQKIENYLDGKEELPLAEGEKVGKTVDYVAGRNRYLGFLLSLPKRSFRGLRIGLDCANGSAWAISKAVFDALGAEVFLIGAEPDGTNINRGCGAVCPARLRELVLREKLDVGYAFDGDADRCICVDEKGEIIDGDGILYICAKFLKGRGELEKKGIAITVMSNSGLVSALKGYGITCKITDVGDRFVYEKMLQDGYSLGGEQSGHIIFRKYSVTGDGILTALMLTEAMLECHCPLSCLIDGFEKLPQVKKNILVKNKTALLKNEKVLAAVKEAQTINDGGRILLRASGTEPVLRLLCEGKNESICRKSAECIERAIAEEDVCAES